MKTFSIRVLLTLVCTLTLLSGVSQAAIQAVGPTSTITTLPTWYMDTTGLPLAPCVDQNGFCILPPPFDPAFPPVSPITTTGPVDDTNFPDESFYYSAFVASPDGVAGSTFNIEGGPGQPAGDRIIFGYVLEFAFLSGVVPETGITFLRTDLQKMNNLTPSATYRVTHPYGQFEFQTDAAGTTIDAGPGTRFEDQPGTIANWLPPLFKAAPNTNIGPFLLPVGGAASFITDPGTGHTYIGDTVTPVEITGSPTGNNFVLIERLDAAGLPVAAWQSSFFTLMGQVYTDQIPSPLAIDSTTYASDGVNGQLDTFVTAPSGATISISGTGIPTTALTEAVPNTGKYFAHIPFAGPLPTGVTFESSLDVPAIPYPVTPVDEVIITSAIYNPDIQLLTLKAISRDTMLPAVTLSAPAFGNPLDPLANVFDATGSLTVDLTGTIPPLDVEVVSSQGGRASARVSVASFIEPVAYITVPATSSNGSINVYWGPSPTPNVDGYTLEESSDGGLTWSVVFDGAVRSVVLDGRAAGTYHYRVFAHKAGLAPSAAKEGANPCVVTLQVARVAYITVPASSTAGSVNVFWGTSTTPNVDGYTLEESSDGGATWSVAYDGVSRSVVLDGRAPGTYLYRVSAYKAGYTTSLPLEGSNPCVVTLQVAPVAYISVPTTSTTGSLNVFWGTSVTPSVDGYTLEESSDGGVTWTVAFDGTSRSVILSGRVPGSYQYRVSAYKVGYLTSPAKVGANPCVVQ